MRVALLPFLLLPFLLSPPLARPQDFPDIRFLPVIAGLDRPVHITHAGDNSRRLFLVEQTGRIRILRDHALLETPFLDIRDRVSCCGERGLLSLAFPPDFPTRRHFYVNYTNRNGATIIARYDVSANPDLANRDSERILLTIPQPFANHNGGLIKFSPRDGFLYIATGDGGGANDPLNAGQDRRTLLGKLLRIDPLSAAPGAYLIPPSNPFARDPAVLPEIWALGLRNPWKFSFDRDTADLYIADVGQNNLEEINFQPASSTGGENYGWNIMEGSQCFRAPCSQAGLTLPIAEYNHTSGNCSVTGGYVYRGRRLPALQGIYFYGDYCSGRVWGLRRVGPSWASRPLTVIPYLISTFGEDETGEIYVANLNNGEISLLSTGAPATSPAGVVNAASFQPGLVAGSLATLFGTALSSAFGVASARSFPLPQELAGASLLLDGLRVPLLAVSGSGEREQINFQIPWEAAGKPEVTLVLENRGRRGEPLRLPLAAHAPALFTYPVEQTSAPPLPAAASLFALTGAPVLPLSPAAPGDLLSLFATGLGPVDNPPPTGAPAPASPLARTLDLPAVFIDNRPAAVLFSGLAPGFAGLYQITIRIPEGVSPGWREIRLRIGSRESAPAWLPLRNS